MTAKEYLQSVKDADTDIKRMIEDLNMMRETMYSIQGVQIGGDRVQTSLTGGAKFEGTFLKIDEKERQIQQKINDLIDFKLKVSEQISGLKNPTHKRVLHMRYLQFKKWYDIGVEMGYKVDEERRSCGALVRYFHPEALKAFEAKYHDMLQEMGG